MIVKEHKGIEFINICKCQFGRVDLENAIDWYSDKPVARVKNIYIYGKYPAISIYDKKIHIHRLLMMYWEERDLERNEYVHHKDGNPLNALRYNLEIQSAFEHQRQTNKGRKQSPEHIARRIDATTKTRYGHSIYENGELLDEHTNLSNRQKNGG